MGCTGNFLHPGFVYSLLNCGFFIVFAFGPYTYKFNIDWLYYYIYVLVVWMFVIGVMWGGAIVSSNKVVKDLKIKPLPLFFIYIAVLFLFGSSLTQLTSLDGSIIESGVENRIEQLNNAQANFNITSFILNIVEKSFTRLGTAIVTAYAIFQRRNYTRVAILFIVISLSTLLTNSRTNLITSLIPLFVPIYIVLKDRGLIDFTSINWSKNLKYIIPTFTLIIVGITLMTNARSAVIAYNYEIPYEYVESSTELQRKPWFNEFTNSQTVAVVNPIAELSIYAGSTVAHGGFITDIAMNNNLRTWGLRNIFPVHRVLAQFKLDAGISNLAIKNYKRIIARAISYRSSIQYSWWGSPANFIVDFGYVGAPLASLITGWLIGWIYGQSSNSGPIFKSTTYSAIFPTSSANFSPCCNIVLRINNE